MDTWGGITPRSGRLVVYIDKYSPATAGLSAEAICPVWACQMAPCPRPSPDRENSAGAGTSTAGVYRSALDVVPAPPVIKTLPLESSVAVGPKRPTVMSPVRENTAV